MPAQLPRLSPTEMDRLSRLAGMVADVAPGTPEARSFSDVRLQQQFSALEKKIDDDINQRRLDDFTAAQRSQRQSLIDSGRYTEEQVKEIETGPMAKYGLGDYDAGAAIYASQHPPVHPADKMPTAEDHTPTWDLPSVPGTDGKMMPLKDFMSNPVKQSLNAAYRTIQEFKQARLSPAFRR